MAGNEDEIGKKYNIKVLGSTTGINYFRFRLPGQTSGGMKIPEVKPEQGYPWINFYKNGKAVQFKGRRHVPKIVTFMFQRITQSGFQFLSA